MSIFKRFWVALIINFTKDDSDFRKVGRIIRVPYKNKTDAIIINGHYWKCNSLMKKNMKS